MPRIRYIKPDFFHDEHLAKVDATTRLAFAGLWCYADREGKLKDRPEYLKAMIFPYDPVDMDKILSVLAEYKKPNGKAFITRYSINGDKYIQVNEFQKHQLIHHTEKQSAIPNNPNFNGYLTVKHQIKKEGMGNGELVMGNGDRVSVKTNTHSSKDCLSKKPTEPAKTGRKQFVPPTLEEIDEYCKKRGNNVDPIKWHAHYSARGWMMGKNKMVNWKAAVVTWERREDEVKCGPPKLKDIA